MRKFRRLHLLPDLPVWIAVGLFILAFLPRLVAIGRYITPDELIWVYRSVLFREALLDGRWAETLVAGHPGVTTMWLGTIGISLQMGFVPEAAATYEWITKLAFLTPDNTAAFQQLASLLSAARLAIIFINCTGVVLIYLLTRQLWGPVVALVGSLFLAFDPFLIGLSGILHVDGLATTFVTISLLALLVGMREKIGDWRLGVRKGKGGLNSVQLGERKQTMNGQLGEANSIHHSQFIISGITAALAILTKSPALLILPVTAVVFAWVLWQRYRSGRQSGARDWFGRTITQGLIWLVSFGLSALLLFPALWSAPLSVWQLMTSSAGRHIDEALRPTFFLGEVAFDHGPLFYPIVLLWRLSPVVMIGLGLALVAWFRWRETGWMRAAWVLLLWAIVFLAAITPAAKKFDRYLLPVVPALILLAALGWIAWTQGSHRGRRWLLAAALLGQIGYWLLFWSYPLAAYNLLVGGPLTATQVMPLGWGEGISTAGRWLTASQPDAAEASAVSGIAPSLAPFFSGETLLAEAGGREQADYVIYTAGSKQESDSGLSAETAGLELLHTVRYGGLEQAWVYRQPEPQRTEQTVEALAEPVVFDGRVALQAIHAEAEPEAIMLRAHWQRLQPAGHTILRLSLRDEEGNIWSGLETPLLNEVYFYPEDWAADERPEVAYRLQRPPAMPPGDYALVLTMFDEASGGQLAVMNEGGVFAGVEYEVASVTIEPEETPVAVERLAIPQVANGSWFDGTLLLLGHSAVPPTILAGETLSLDVFWQAAGALPADVYLEWTLAGAEAQGGAVGSGEWGVGSEEEERKSLNLQSAISTWAFPLSRYGSEQWRVGETVHEKVRLPLAADLAAGKYVLRVAPVGEEPAWEVGRLEVVAADRLFQLPDDVGIPLAHEFGEGIHLSGSKLLAEEVATGEAAEVVLYWQTDSQPAAIYTVFVHLLDEQENIVAQADHWPGGLPTHTLAAGQVVVDEFVLPIGADVPPSQYRIAVGLYTADNGLRLPVDNGAADRVILPQLLNVVAADQ